MKLKKYIFILLLLFFSIEIAQVQAQQSLNYEYSATGNRKKVYVGFAKIAATPDKQEEYTETLDNIQFRIYPNPTKGLLKIDIETEMKVDNLRIEMYDANGKQIFEKSAKSKEIELDITSAVAGNYFIKLFVNDKPYYWNILKEGE